MTYFFSITFGLYLIIKLLQYKHLELPLFIYHYLPDLLCLPVVLSATHIVLKQITSRFTEFSNTQLLVAWLYMSSSFELILPQFSKTYTADIYDVAMYFTGIVIFKLFSLAYNQKTTTAC